ncbi:MAG TPA: (2Fe-2S)-binding protein [Bacteroidota bacterium]|nr:(2Fe-2S)-binding protein [Bacteroidota bacterium]
MVDRCICFDRTFAELKTAAEQAGVWDVEALQRVVPFGLRCGLCKPYVERMLCTGRVVFPVIRSYVDPCAGD